tara:strand:+ start:4978 stop:6759 length:1782 start_codon:yes stop_codon:yes gene_type:complete
MKWIGEHIQEIVARFRSSVYLEGITSGTPNAFISVDSNKKIVTGIPTIESVGTVTSGTWRGTEVGVAYGGTGLTSYTQGDILYYNTGGSLSKLGIGSAGEVLKVNSGATAPEWGADASGLSFNGSTSNGLCTYGGSAQVDVESDLTYNSEILTIGANDDGAATIKRFKHDDGVGGTLKIMAGDSDGTNTAGGHLALYGGEGNGTATSGSIRFFGHASGASMGEIAHIDSSGNLQVDGGITTGSTSFANSSGLLQVANQSNITGVGTISSGTWEGTDIGVAHGGTGLSTVGTNEILTGNGTGALTSESTLTYDSETLTIGADDNGAATIERRTHSDEAGGSLSVKGGTATGTDKAGGSCRLYGGQGTGQGVGGDVQFYVYKATADSDADLNTTPSSMTFSGTDGSLSLGGDLNGLRDNIFNINSDQSMRFKIDADDDDTGQSFAFYNAGTEIANLSESGNLQIDGRLTESTRTRIKILPRDFIPDDAGRPAMMDDTGSDRWLESHGTSKLYVSIDIPTGYTATHVNIYGSATSAITVYEADINSKTVTSKGTGNIGTEIDITDVASDTTNYLLIELAQASGEEVYGGYVTIAVT